MANSLSGQAPARATLEKEDAYAVLRRAIVDLYLKPGKIVSIRDLCLHFHISRTPAHDALVHLEQEGLVTFLPQRGTMISKIDIARVKEERFLRLCLEKEVMRLFMAGHTPEHIRQLEEKIAEQEECVKANDLRRLVDADDEFHFVFYRAVGKRFCAQIVQNQLGSYRRVRLLTCVDAGIRENVVREHREMMRAIQEGTESAMSELLQHHLGKIEGEKNMFFAQFPELFLQDRIAGREADQLSADFLAAIEK